MNQLWLWIGFNLFVFAMLAIDLGLFNRKAHASGMKEAGTWCAVCVATALAFNYGIYYFRGKEAALQFLGGYLVEMALSADNIFVFVLIFAYFNVKLKYQHRVLFWGIIGALILRGGMIWAGTELVQEFEWILYIFGAFLVYTGIKMAVQKEGAIEPEANPILKLVRRMMPVSASFHGEKFFVREAHGPAGKLRLVATPLFVVLVMIDVADLIFAVDSIPAVIGITQDQLIVYTSNVFAILCLRALYFLIANLIEKFRFLQLALSIILTFVGVKMLIVKFYDIPIEASVLIIIGVLAVATVASILLPKKSEGKLSVDDEDAVRAETAEEPDATGKNGE